MRFNQRRSPIDGDKVTIQSRGYNQFRLAIDVIFRIPISTWLDRLRNRCGTMPQATAIAPPYASANPKQSGA
jgi:hypothetical protein